MIAIVHPRVWSADYLEPAAASDRREPLRLRDRCPFEQWLRVVDAPLLHEQQPGRMYRGRPRLVVAPDAPRPRGAQSRPLGHCPRDYTAAAREGIARLLARNIVEGWRRRSSRSRHATVRVPCAS